MLPLFFTRIVINIVSTVTHTAKSMANRLAEAMAPEQLEPPNAMHHIKFIISNTA